MHCPSFKMISLSVLYSWQPFCSHECEYTRFKSALDLSRPKPANDRVTLETHGILKYYSQMCSVN